MQWFLASVLPPFPPLPPTTIPALYPCTNYLSPSLGLCSLHGKVWLTLSVVDQIPEETAVAKCCFETVEDASNAVLSLVRKGVQVGCVELLDDEMIA